MQNHRSSKQDDETAPGIGNNNSGTLRIEIGSVNFNFAPVVQVYREKKRPSGQDWNDDDGEETAGAGALPPAALEGSLKALEEGLEALPPVRNSSVPRRCSRRAAQIDGGGSS